MPDALVNVARIVGGGICVAAEDGHKVHDAILVAIRRGDRVIISFENVTRMTTAFLNAAVGQLYGELEEEEIRQRMGSPVNISPRQANQLRLVVERAKDYFKDPAKVKKSFFDITGIEENDDN
jgi:hypothetical protein